jgi:hypothetical protein
MSALGWVFMIVSWGGIIALAVFCFAKVFTKRDMD